jgi:hypothetical protein
MKGTKFNRLLFQLQPRTLRTEEIDVGSLDFGMLPTITASFGERGGNLNPESNHDTERAMRVAIPKLMMLLKTPCSADAYTENLTKKEQKFGNSGTLAQEVQTGFIYQRGMLPTPTGMVGDAYADNSPNSHLRHTPNLATLAAKGMLPTPATRDYKGANSMEHLKGENGTVMNHIGQLPNYLKFHIGQTSQLNPQFVAEMMGFPHNWTELPFQSGEQNPSKDTETP